MPENRFTGYYYVNYNDINVHERIAYSLWGLLLNIAPVRRNNKALSKKASFLIVIIDLIVNQS